jgi:putative transposase
MDAYTKNKRVFPNDTGVFKTLYLTIEYITAKWTMPVRNWPLALNQFEILCGEYKCELIRNIN